MHESIIAFEVKIVIGLECAILTCQLVNCIYWYTSPNNCNALTIQQHIHMHIISLGAFAEHADVVPSKLYFPHIDNKSFIYNCGNFRGCKNFRRLWKDALNYLNLNG